MAVTKKERSRKAAVKKEQLVITPAVVVPESHAQEHITPEQKDFLSPEHLMTLETKERDVENARLKMALQEQYTQNLRLQLKLLDDSIKKQESIQAQCAAAYKQQLQHFDAIKREIFPLYGFKENQGLGYDPVSGKIAR